MQERTERGVGLCVRVCVCVCAASWHGELPCTYRERRVDVVELEAAAGEPHRTAAPISTTDTTSRQCDAASPSRGIASTCSTTTNLKPQPVGAAGFIGGHSLDRNTHAVAGVLGPERAQCGAWVGEHVQ